MPVSSPENHRWSAVATMMAARGWLLLLWSGCCRFVVGFIGLFYVFFFLIRFEQVLVLVFDLDFLVFGRKFFQFFKATFWIL